MKTRSGFVSNSSTSSFILFGWKLEEHECLRVIRNLIEASSNNMNSKDNRISLEEIDYDENILEEFRQRVRLLFGEDAVVCLEDYTPFLEAVYIGITSCGRLTQKNCNDMFLKTDHVRKILKLEREAVMISLSSDNGGMVVTE